MIVEKDTFLYLSKLNITGIDFKILFYLISILRLDEYTCVSQQAIGNELGFKRQQVNISIKRILEQELILKGNPIGNQQTYKINTDNLKIKER